MRRDFQKIPAGGFSLVELMVAMVIGLIGMIIIFQVFEVSEGIRRTTTGGGDAQQNGTIALYQMERDLRNAGMGLSETDLAGCYLAGSDSSQTPNQFFKAADKIPLTPVYIVPGATAAVPDTISVMYGSQGEIAEATQFTADMTDFISPFSVQNRFGFRTGDLILLAQPGTFPAQTCNFMEVTGLPSGAQSTQIVHANGTYTYTDSLNNTITVTSRFNPGAGLGVKYGGSGSTTAATRVFDLGNLYDPKAPPVYNTYAVANNTLTVKSAFSSNPAVAVADNIVDMRALYGLDDGNITTGTVIVSYSPGAPGDGIADRYVNSTTFGTIVPLPWANIIAVRVAVVARSATPETSSKGVGQACDATVSAPTWSGGTFPAVQADPNWQCYRYRVYETTVPIRNWIWKAS